MDNTSGLCRCTLPPPQDALTPALPTSPSQIHSLRAFSTSRPAPLEANSNIGKSGVPDWSAYKHSNPSNNRTLQYFMVGSLGVLAASGAKSTVSDILSNMAASADVLALAKIEVEMSSIPEGKLGCFSLVLAGLMSSLLSVSLADRGRTIRLKSAWQ